MPRLKLTPGSTEMLLRALELYLDHNRVKPWDKDLYNQVKEDLENAKMLLDEAIQR